MTTVVITDNKVYCDSQATAGGMITDYNVNKALNLGHCIVAGAGRWSHVVKFQQWVADNVLADIAQQEHPYVNVQIPEELVEEDFQGAILYPDGVVVMFEGGRDSFECEQPVYLGSGSSFAAGAITAGADGETAVQTAIYLDPYSGGDVKVEEFEKQAAPVTKESLAELSKEEILEKLFPQPNDDCTMMCGYDDKPSELLKDDDLILTDVKGTKWEVSFSLDEDDNIDDIFISNKLCYNINKRDLSDMSIDVLKLLADDWEIPYAHNIGIEKLSDKIVSYFELEIIEFLSE